MMGEKEETRGSVGVWQDVAASLRADTAWGMRAEQDGDYEEGRFVEGLIHTLLREHHRLRVVDQGARRRESSLNAEVAGLYHAIREAGVGVALIAEERVRQSIKLKRSTAPIIPEINITADLWSILSGMDEKELTQVGVLCAAFIDEKLGVEVKPVIGSGVTFTDTMDSAGHPWDERGAKDE